VLDALLSASPIAFGFVALWMLPNWIRKWIVVAREVRELATGGHTIGSPGNRPVPSGARAIPCPDAATRCA
jgi:hypothetical protein